MAATPLITEVLQQLQSSNTGLWSPPTEYVASNQHAQASANHQPKRLQVPKACSNCRKMHAGCDHVRPCKRCVQNGLEATCVDVPRKKRVSKKRTRPEDLVEVKHEQVAPSTPSLPNTALVVSTQQKIEDPNKMWEDTYNELFGGTIADQLQPPPRRGSLEFNPFSYQPDSYLLSEIPSSPLQYNRAVITNMPPATPSPPQPSNSYDFDYLLTQIRELHDSNKTLESKLMGVTNELIDMKKSPSIPNLLNPSGVNRPLLTGTQTGWHSFGSQQDVAVSLWKTTGTTMGNVLLECNTKFVQLLGYSLEVLGNNFNCTNMIRQQDLCGDKDNCKAWPKRTQIITATGLKDVLVTITPVQTGKDKLPPNTKYFLVNMTEPSE
jgi:hypothetical protein